MNVALGATIKGKNQRAREFNKGPRNTDPRDCGKMLGKAGDKNPAQVA